MGPGSRSGTTPCRCDGLHLNRSSRPLSRDPSCLAATPWWVRVGLLGSATEAPKDYLSAYGRDARIANLLCYRLRAGRPWCRACAHWEANEPLMVTEKVAVDADKTTEVDDANRVNRNHVRKLFFKFRNIAIEMNELAGPTSCTRCAESSFIYLLAVSFGRETMMSHAPKRRDYNGLTDNAQAGSVHGVDFEGLALAVEGAGQEIEPVLPPEHLAVEHVAR